MNKKKLMIGVGVIAVILAGLMMIRSCAVRFSARKQKGAAQAMKKTGDKAAAVKPEAPAPAKRTIPKGKGLLIVKALDHKGGELSAKITAFKSENLRSSVMSASFATGRPCELLPGAYDIELSTTPRMLYKGIRVAEGKENTENLGSITGQLTVKAQNSMKAAAAYPVKVMSAGTGQIVTSISANRPTQILGGVYDLEIGTAPVHIRKDVRVTAGKDAVVDIGVVTGAMNIKAVDENGKPVRYSVKVMKAGSRAVVYSGSANRSVELLEGLYDVESAAGPAQIKKDVSVKKGVVTDVDFAVKAAPAIKR